MKSKNAVCMVISLFASLSLLLAACSGKGNSGAYVGKGATSARFNVSGSSQLVALSNTVASSGGESASGGVWSSVASLFGKKPLLQYRIVNEGLTDAEIKARLKGKTAAVTAVGAAGGSQQTGTNLLSLDSDGNAELAIDSNYMIKVMYSVTDPNGEYVYLALDTGFVNPDGNDYSPFIAQNNCAFYRVSISDDSSSCVMEGVYVQPMDEKYLKTVSSNVKPIQFDSAGNMYFPGSTFTRKCDGGSCKLFVSNWKPRIYRVSATDGTVTALTQDNQVVDYYLALNTGEIAYQASTGKITGGGDMPISFDTSALYVWQPSQSPNTPNGTTINLTGVALIDFFSVDNYNTIMYGSFYLDGIRFARPALSGSGVDKAVLSTMNLCSGQECSYSSAYPPSKIIVGDDGKLYGVFGPSYSEDEDGIGYQVLKVYQVLPFLSVPKAEIKYSEDLSYIPVNIWGGTPFQVSRGYFFYKETTENLGYGVMDVIKMVNLDTRDAYTLLNDPNTWFELYNWRLRGDKLYFSALDLARTVVVSGEIDVKLFQENPNRSQVEYLTINDMASAIGATSRVQDIEGLGALPQIALPPSPSVTQIYTSAENLYSTSIEFNTLMDPRATEPAAAITDAGSSAIASMKVWISNYLHMIPDLDDNGTGLPNDALLDLQGSTPLQTSATYNVSISAAATDVNGVPLAAPSSNQFKTRPDDGWYVSADSPANKVAKFANTDAQNWSAPSEYYDLRVHNGAKYTVPADFILTFRAKNFDYQGMRVVLFNITNPGGNPPSPYSSNYNRDLFNISLGYWPYLNYRYCGSGPPCSWLNGTGLNTGSDYHPKLFNGNWVEVRIEVNGGTIAASYKEEGGSSPRTIVFSGVDFTARPLYGRDGSQDFQLLLGFKGEMAVDDIKVTDLSGATIYVDENFDARAEGVDGITVSAPTLTGGTPNVPDLDTPLYNDVSPYDYLSDVY